ncbi:hypothetical protein, partial [Pseudohoeflea suaedae]|uniref:hypothetical protein n=1 Tax=Pseudohoeflea suaedae TaxID=877384 RepID=UPI001305001E
LKATIDNDSKPGATDTGFGDAIAVEVDGIGGTSATGSFTVTIVDDVPNAVADTGGPVLEGDLLTVDAAAGILANDNRGADGATIA